MKNIRIAGKNISLWLFLIVFFFLFSCSSDHSDDGTRFENKTLRMDYLHSGDKNYSSIEFLAWKEEPFWGGSRRNLIDDPLKGEFYS